MKYLRDPTRADAYKKARDFAASEGVKFYEPQQLAA